MAFSIYFIFIEVKIKEFTSMDLIEIKTEGNFIRLRDSVYFSLILLNSYIAKLFGKLNFSWFYFRLAGGKLPGGFLYWL